MNTKNISLSNNDKLTFISNFATMLAAGISILEAVDSLLEDAKGNQKKLLQVLRADLIQGKHVHAAFAQFPNIFDKVTVNIIKASEDAGTLDQALKDLNINIKKQIEFNDKVKSALTYPILIFTVFGGVLLMMLVVVIPKISTVFKRLNVVLPLPTKILIFFSDLLINNTIPLLAGTAISLTLFIFLYKHNKRLVLNAFFSLPLISGLAQQIDLTKWTRSLNLMLSSGIPITQALDLTKGVVSKKEILHIVERAYQSVLSGKTLSDGLRSKKKLIPSMMIKMIEVGEKSGSLEKSLAEVSEQMDYQVSKTLKTLTTLLEPIMLVLIGVLIGGMMLAIIAPIYGLVGQINTR